jgi:hypothetical protein
MNVPEKAHHKNHEETRILDHLNCVFLFLCTICFVKFGLTVFLVLHIDITIGIALFSYQ